MEQRPKFCPRPCHASSGNGDELVGHTPIDSSTLEGKKGRCVFLGGVWGGGGVREEALRCLLPQAVFLSYFSSRGTNTY